MKVINTHVASIGYNSSDPFSLVLWAARAGSQGYTEAIEEEFHIFLFKPEDKAIVDSYDDGEVLLSGHTEDKYEAYGESREGYKLVVQPISKLVGVDGMDMYATETRVDKG